MAPIILFEFASTKNQLLLILHHTIWYHVNIRSTCPQSFCVSLLSDYKEQKMYTKFNYSPSDFFYNHTLNSHIETGRNIYECHKKEVHDCLAEYITEDGIINGTSLKDHWFSISKKDIFISHSHNDINKVKAFAGWLHNCFGLESFIDSCSWGYCDDLLNKIDKRYCYSAKKGTYDYKLRNYTTSHVHMMLSTALTEMIDQTECIIFFNTPNSINLATELEKIKRRGKEHTTISPWIYHELSMTTMLRSVTPVRKETVLEHYAQASREKPKIAYDVSKALNAMATLTDTQLEQWKCNWDQAHKIIPHALDELYKIVFPK